jgi:peptidoglycan/xylan/chitin deacetylase (PgdA/CDA1 family)
MTSVAFTVDLEQDCPPYLSSYRGAEEGMPRLLALLRALAIPATVFTTGDVARRYPDLVRAVVAAGHEIGCHGDTHRAFDVIDDLEALAEVATSTATLRTFGAVSAFRAPYLRLPRRHLGLLREHGYTIDASEASYKRPGLTMREEGDLVRVPASITSSALRLPALARDALLTALRGPLVLFVHPWELVDLRRGPIRWDCRVATGPYAARAIADALGRLRDRGATFHPISGLVEERRREYAREKAHERERDALHG